MSDAPREAYVFQKDRFWVRAGEWVLYALGTLVRWSIRPLGTWAAARLLSPLGGWAARRLPSVRRRAMENLVLVWPDRAAEHDRILDEAGRHFVHLAIEYCQFDRVVRGFEISTEGVNRLEEELASGRGAVIASAHYGNWEAVRIALKRRSIECGIIYRAFNNRYLDSYTLRLIGAAGEPVLQKGPAGLRELIRHLGRGGVAMVLVDQRNSGAPFVPFLGEPAETMTTAAEIATRTGAALVPAVARRDIAARRFEVRIEAPVTADTPEAAMGEVNRRISAWIEADPGQWFWFHRRWKSTRRSRSKP